MSPAALNVNSWSIALTTVDTGSEDTFREMLRIKRAVQASYNTEASFVAAQAAAAAKGGEKPTAAAAAAAKEAADPMAAMERNMGKGSGAPAFVASTIKPANSGAESAEVDVSNGAEDEAAAANPDAIAVDDDEF